MRSQQDKRCPECGNDYGLSEFFEFYANRANDRVFCSQCQTKNFLIDGVQGAEYKLVGLISTLLILIGIIGGFWLVEKQFSNLEHKVISVAHFLFAVLGALFGLAIADGLKQLSRWKSGYISGSAS